MGRSAIDHLCRIADQSDLAEKVLLIGKRFQKIFINDIKFTIHESSSTYDLIESGAIFFNAAFLRRELLQTMNADDYIRECSSISNFAKRILQEKRLKCFINLSSGVAGHQELPNNSPIVDPYTSLKKALEIEYSNISNNTKTALINCRIYSLTGKHLNEFNNLALSSFILQAKTGNIINVKSPLTRRTYINSVELARFLLEKSALGISETFDSGGILVSFTELARTIGKVIRGTDFKIVSGDEHPQHYFGNYESFNYQATEMGIKLSDLESQIQNTLKAFDKI